MIYSNTNCRIEVAIKKIQTMIDFFKDIGYSIISGESNHYVTDDDVKFNKV